MAQISRNRTSSAFCWMKALRGATSSPIKVTKTSSARAASSISTWRRVRVAGFIVVSQSSWAFISAKALESGRLHLGVFLLEALELGVVFQVMDLGPHLHSIEGWLGDVDVPVLDQRLQVAEEQVRSRVRMWAPSTSASASRTIL